MVHTQQLPAGKESLKGSSNMFTTMCKAWFVFSVAVAFADHGRCSTLEIGSRDA